jgi:serpin B
MKRCLWLALLPAVFAVALGCFRKKEDASDDGELAVSVARPAKADDAVEADVDAVAAGNNAFALDLHRRLPGGNAFFSPLSVSTALSMSYAGARGETAEEMSKALRHPFAGKRLHLGYAGLLGKPGAARGVELSMANALWGQEEFNEDFLAVNRDHYAADLRKINLIGAEPVINKWAEEHTDGRIKGLLPEHFFDRNSVLALTNAVYFRGRWAARFDRDDTRQEPFRFADGKTVQVPMMRQTARLALGAIDSGKPGAAQVLIMPYRGGDVSMVVVLPSKADGLPAVEKALTAQWLDEAVKRAGKTKVRVRLPRFTIKGETISLKEQLRDLGIRRAFTPEADFSGACSGVLFIADVLHQASVEVNEEGSEAAAATVVKKEKGKEPEEKEFVADHPFLFLIRDNRTGCILFLGRLSKPE